MSIELANMKEYGHFVNTSPIPLEWLRAEWWGPHFFGMGYQVDIWEYTAPRNVEKRLTWISPEGHKVQLDRHFETDFGSIPPPLGVFPSLTRTRFLPPFLFHDSGCQHGGLWIEKAGTNGFVFYDMTRLELDRLLRVWVGAWGGNALQRCEIYTGVRIGAPFMKFPTGDVRRRTKQRQKVT